MPRTIVLLLLTFYAYLAGAQGTAPRQLPATRTTATIKIDGVLEETAWKETKPATNFVEWRPTFGVIEDSATRTEIYFLYDNTAVYVGGYCHERTRDSISRELIGRDRIGVNDYVGVVFDTYYDKINAFGFYVTPLGEQYDAKYSSTAGEDDTWNAVWDSESKVVADGWTFEMRIPFSMLRFNSKDLQTWGLNITRNRKIVGRQFMWNPVDPKVNGFVNQEGEWTGIERIEAPIRLSFSPYFSTYANHYPYKDADLKNTTASVNGGMDVKYGINESFTLDATLIPDFGQVQSDNQVLNLTPFEIKFNENRPFFNEGTELFNKGELFYSRRIGGRPLHFYDVGSSLAENERIRKNPSEARLINAAKVSGRTKKKLGIGFFNALTKPMYAEVEDDAKNRRKIQTAPLTNYNILVLDQSLKNNSSVSLINTNVLRNGADYDANVTAGLFDFNNKKNTYNVNGKVAVSQITGGPDVKSRVGYAHFLGLRKSGGRLLFNLTQDLTDNKYDINDMGILFNNNYIDHYLWVAYRWLEPKSWYNRIQVNYNGTYSRRFKPGDYQSFFTNVNANIQAKKLWWAGVFVGYNARGNDFYEPRKQGHVFRTPATWRFNIWMESNYTKKYSYGGNIFVAAPELFNGRRFEYFFYHKYRFGDQFSLAHELSYEPTRNEAGFYNLLDSYVPGTSGVLFSRRDRKTVTNILNAKYSFSNRAGITFRVRHYWSKVEPQELFDLNGDGSLSQTKNGGITPENRNYNTFNIDAVYTWQFAPGSFINVVWKNAIERFDDQVAHGYFKNFDRTITGPQNNNLSLKVIYFLDYLDFKKWRKRND
jgi:hypothetical protein